MMRFLILLVAILWPEITRAGEIFPPAPIGQVTIRALPAYTVVEAEETGTLDAVWTKGFRLGARYAAYSNSRLNTPTILTFTDWDKISDATGNNVHVFVQIMLDPLPNLSHPHDRGVILVQMPAMTVACCSLSGAYSFESFRWCLDKINAYLTSEKIPKAGPPRYLYYTDTAWVPNWWRTGEVQVPISPGTAQN